MSSNKLEVLSYPHRPADPPLSVSLLDNCTEWAEEKTRFCPIENLKSQNYKWRNYSVAYQTARPFHERIFYEPLVSADL